ncbi:GMC family oxidoreductase [Rhodococcus sp. (in: high G+C Gram-positive bacteria)]|uniref:GMC family oxidoreductase n=1 Tax=Rhodococcus sp. TaxID=1831 RepID=UPI00257B0FE5|nr:GMC family oxidoreductase [Rhodococcus sp. (in: high G+C Gram-positive bacteria)]MBQ9056463.1 GMC family oxidoreductase [Rhodococcus sp. (in: high G+C Gram-positive bacteria)]
MSRNRSRTLGTTPVDDDDFDFDWIVIVSGFGGSVAALRLTEKGYRVAVVERGRRYADEELPASASDHRRFLWAPAFGLRGIMRNTLFPHVFSSSQTGVGGGSLVYGGVLFRAQPGFYADAQWRDLADWEEKLAPHYVNAERMLGVQTVPWESVTMGLTQEVAEHFGSSRDLALAPVGVFFGEPGKTVPDPYFGGEGPDRTGCIRCGECMTGCRVGAANRLTKNYLWFAEKRGAQVIAEREVVDVVALGDGDGKDGYAVATRRPGARLRGKAQTLTARGVVFAAGTVSTNELLANCKHRGSLPRISDRLGAVVRTNSETVLTVLLPEDVETWRDVTASSRVVLDGDTQIEFLTYGRNGDFMRLLFTLLTGPGTRSRRIARWASNLLRNPGRWAATLRSDWSRRTVMMLVMQARDNAIAFVPVKRNFGKGYRLTTRPDDERPAPAHIEIGHQVATWLAQRTGGIAQSSIFEALGNRPMTAHMLGGAAIGADTETGVVDANLNVFGYQNMIVCDGAALPANPGVNPALTITALAEYSMERVPNAGVNPRRKPRSRELGEYEHD